MSERYEQTYSGPKSLSSFLVVCVSGFVFVSEKKSKAAEKKKKKKGDKPNAIWGYFIGESPLSIHDLPTPLTP